MTKIQYEHHQDQMEAFRRDFQKDFTRTKAALLSAGFTHKQVAIQEKRQWTYWLKAKKGKSP